MVVVNYEDMELAELSLVAWWQHFTGRRVNHNLFGFQMCIPLQQDNGEAWPLQTVFTLFGANLAVVHLSNGFTQVQTNASALHTHVISVTTLIETVEHMGGIFGFDAHARVNDL